MFLSSVPDSDSSARGHRAPPKGRDPKEGQGAQLSPHAQLAQEAALAPSPPSLFQGRRRDPSQALPDAGGPADPIMLRSHSRAPPLSPPAQAEPNSALLGTGDSPSSQKKPKPVPNPTPSIPGCSQGRGSQDKLHCNRFLKTEVFIKVLSKFCNKRYKRAGDPYFWD